MQELTLVEVIDFLPGGSTKPLLISALNENDEIKSFALKIFTKKQVRDLLSVAKEIFVNEFAKEFTLNVPEYGIINFDHSRLKPFFSDEELEELDSGYKFCSEYHENYVIYNPIANLSFINEYDIENLFAFDCVVMNVDRGGYHKKPNLLINNTEMLLIDHELTLPMIDGINFDYNINYYNNFISFNHENHIFWNFLKNKRKKDNIFDEFIVNLQCTNIQKFDALFEKMTTFNINFGDRNKIISYLNWAKTNCGFINKNLYHRIK